MKLWVMSDLGVGPAWILLGRAMSWNYSVIKVYTSLYELNL